jgi:hypothetical protein
MNLYVKICILILALLIVAAYNINGYILYNILYNIKNEFKNGKIQYNELLDNIINVTKNGTFGYIVAIIVLILLVISFIMLLIQYNIDNNDNKKDLLLTFTFLLRVTTIMNIISGILASGFIIFRYYIAKSIKEITNNDYEVNNLVNKLVNENIFNYIIGILSSITSGLLLLSVSGFLYYS